MCIGHVSTSQHPLRLYTIIHCQLKYENTTLKKKFANNSYIVTKIIKAVYLSWSSEYKLSLYLTKLYNVISFRIEFYGYTIPYNDWYEVECTTINP